MFWLFFCERFCTSCCISPTNLKKLTFSGKIVGLLKYVGEIQQLVRKHAQKNNHNVIFHYILLPIYPLDFTKFCPILLGRFLTHNVSVATWFQILVKNWEISIFFNLYYYGRKFRLLTRFDKYYRKKAMNSGKMN